MTTIQNPAGQTIVQKQVRNARLPELKAGFFKLLVAEMALVRLVQCPAAAIKVLRYTLQGSKTISFSTKDPICHWLVTGQPVVMFSNTGWETANAVVTALKRPNPSTQAWILTLKARVP